MWSGIGTPAMSSIVGAMSTFSTMFGILNSTDYLHFNLYYNSLLSSLSTILYFIPSYHTLVLQCPFVTFLPDGTPPRHNDVGTVSLLPRSRFIGLNFPRSAPQLVFSTSLSPFTSVNYWTIHKYDKVSRVCSRSLLEFISYSFVVRNLPIPHITWQSTHNFVSYHANKHTDKQTNSGENSIPAKTVGDNNDYWLQTSNSSFICR